MDRQAGKLDSQALIGLFRNMEGLCSNLPSKDAQLWQQCQQKIRQLSDRKEPVEATGEVHPAISAIHLRERSRDREAPPLSRTRGLRLFPTKEGVLDHFTLIEYCRVDPAYVEACMEVEQKLQAFAKEIDHLLYPWRSVLLQTPRFRDTLLTKDWREVRDADTLMWTMIYYHKERMFLRAIDDLELMARMAKQGDPPQPLETKQQPAPRSPVPTIRGEIDQTEVGQIEEYANRIAGLLEPIETPPIEPTWESELPGLGDTNEIARRIAFEQAKALHPLRVEYRRRVVAVLDDGWEPIADIFEHYTPQTLRRLDGWRREVLDHTDPAKDHIYWLEPRDGKLCPNIHLEKLIRRLEEKFRREAKRTEGTLKRVKPEQQQKSETVAGVERGTDGPEDEVRYSPQEGFTGITDKNKAIWAKRYPHIKDPDREVKKIEEYLRRHPPTAEIVAAQPRRYLDTAWAPDSDWTPNSMQTAPQMPPETFAELAGRIEMKLDLGRILSLHREGFTVTPQEYANFRFDADKLRKRDRYAGALPETLGDPAADTVRLMEYCQEEAKRQLNVVGGAENRGGRGESKEQQGRTLEPLETPGLIEGLKALRSALDGGNGDSISQTRNDLEVYVGSPERLYDALQEPLRGGTADSLERLKWVGDARKSRTNTGLYPALLDALAAPEFIAELERWQGRQNNTPAIEPKTDNKTKRKSKLAKIAMITEHLQTRPTASSQEIHRATGIDDSDVRRLWGPIKKALKEGRAAKPRGWRKDDGNLEAIDNSASCSICHDPIREPFECPECDMEIIRGECRTCHYTQTHPDKAIP